jgi:hypothetical protein
MAIWRGRLAVASLVRIRRVSQCESADAHGTDAKECPMRIALTLIVTLSLATLVFAADED